MNYNVRGLRMNLGEEIAKLGIDPSFRESPAYDSVLAEFRGLIDEMNMGEASEIVRVNNGEGEISFDWTSPYGEKYSMSITCATAGTFKCTVTEEKEPFVGKDGQTIKQKTIVEKVATLDQSGFVILTTNGASLDNFNCDNGRCNNYTWSERKFYDTYGVMMEREYKGFSSSGLQKGIDKVNNNDALYIPRGAFSFFSNDYERRTLLRREYFDTARLVSEDRAKGSTFNGSVPLNTERSLKEMYLDKSLYLEGVVIRPLSQSQIDEMISKENNPKVRDGLNHYAKGRENYSYNSLEDKNFIREENQGKSI